MTKTVIRHIRITSQCAEVEKTTRSFGIPIP